MDVGCGKINLFGIKNHNLPTRRDALSATHLWACSVSVAGGKPSVVIRLAPNN